MADEVGDLKIRPLSPELLAQAKAKLNEEPSRRAADVQAIRDWLKKQPHIVAEPTDQLIVNFLRGCKFSLERTKEKLDMYYTMKTLLPDFFKNRDLTNPVLREILDLGFYTPLPSEDKNGCRVVFMRGGRDEPGKYKMEDMLKVNFMAMDYLLMTDDALIINGMVNVMDMSLIKLGHATQMMPSLIKKVSVCSEEGYPFRPQGMNFINNPSFLDTVFKLFMSFNKEKLNRRTFMHGKDIESLYKNVSKNLLPNDFGGEAGKLDELSNHFIQKLLDWNSWFLADENCGVDEKKRAGRAKTQQDLFGMEGSFRQLSVD